ncbi:preprotein translocase subunit SecA [Gulosibacter molinativorax]|uniref:Protein translocase subunit SecA n=1 Tax=Gulosibacter molinativorax TaxID=256821 RepID=A0ABT7CBS6_9MICO|nr:preprotein translocase subunit SecA [Gulosibacter molinativorax]MDJ1372553.1 preprotein translocase subunit SecA [Gulosibacter molinativorax]QUY62616.1 Protein translocase subunit SecA [Gulosibacter molinativorax]
MASILEKMLRFGEGRQVRRLERMAKDVGKLEGGFEELSDDELREMTTDFRERYEAESEAGKSDKEILDGLLPEAFAAVREAARRTLGQRHYDVQLMGGGALHDGNIAEMKTGEGKTLVATLAAYLNAIPGKGVHVITVNDFLASYQSDLMGRVFRALGMTTGCIVSGLTPAQRREQYAADITYGTNNEFGFDYLRDNMAASVDACVQRGHYFAIVDEVDSILIDEARTPLIISGPASGDVNRWYVEFAKLAKRLKEDRDYEVDEKKRTIGILEPGIDRVEDALGIDNLYEQANTPLISFLNNAIKAKSLFARDKQYVVQNGEVNIVDEHTGRILAGRRYSEGLHQAIEAKEGVQIKAENQTLATVTLQNYFLMYDKLAGMTGTAETEAAEFQSTYGLGVIPIPTNKDLARIDQPDLVYKNEKVKFDQVVEDIVERFDAGQPVLVGTTSVEKSEYLSKLLARRGVKHEVLNAKNHAREAAIVAQAGRKGAITVATNMAGRGTDIMLGGNAEFIAVAEMTVLGLDPEENAEEYEKKWPEILERVKSEVKEEAEEVAELGGLYVLGTERHESRRIDNQLRGRSGRQGDPGESRFYLSMTDDLMRLFNTGAARAIMDNDNTPDDMALESRIVSGAIRKAQTQVESRNAEIRKNVKKYDDVLNEQRQSIYADRRAILEGDDLADKVQGFIDGAISDIVTEHTGGADPAEWDVEALETDLKQLYPVTVTVEEIVEEHGEDRVSSEDVVAEVRSDAKLAYDKREELLGEDAMRELERRVVLQVIDRKWRDHLYEMDSLKDGIGLRAMAQRNPLVEYQREGFEMYQQMLGGIREESVGFLMNLDVQVTEVEAEDGSKQRQVRIQAKGLDAQQPQRLNYSAADDQGNVQVTDGSGQVNANATRAAIRKEMSQGTASALSEARAGAGEAPAGSVARSAKAPAGRPAPKKAKSKSGNPAKHGATQGRSAADLAREQARASQQKTQVGAFGQKTSASGATKRPPAKPSGAKHATEKPDTDAE